MEAVSEEASAGSAEAATIGSSRLVVLFNMRHCVEGEDGVECATLEVVVVEGGRGNPELNRTWPIPATLAGTEQVLQHETAVELVGVHAGEGRHRGLRNALSLGGAAREHLRTTLRAGRGRRGEAW